MGKFSKKEIIMKPFHQIENVQFINDLFKIKIDGKVYTFKLSEISKKLAKASPSERENFKISPSGYGIHWPAIDEDLSINGLLGIKHKPAFRKKATSKL